MKALTLHQPWASLVELRVKTIETRSWSTSHRGRLAIHAGKREPVQVEKGFLLAKCDAPVGAPPTNWLLLGADPVTHGPWPVALGAVVATCTLIDVVPMHDTCAEPIPDDLLYVTIDGNGLYRQQVKGDPWVASNVITTDLTDQLPYGDFAPGRFAWLLDDIKPITERCPRCWGTGDHEQIDPITDEVIDADIRMPCTRCDGDGACDPVPAKGRQGLWEWAAA